MASRNAMCQEIVPGQCANDKTLDGLGGEDLKDLGGVRKLVAWLRKAFILSEAENAAVGGHYSLE